MDANKQTCKPFIIYNISVIIDIIIIIIIITLKFCGFVRWDSSVGIASRCGLDGPRIESRWGPDYQHPSRQNLGAHPASYTMDTGSFPGVKRTGRDADHPHPPI
jgi:hypothetical protein